MPHNPREACQGWNQHRPYGYAFKGVPPHGHVIEPNAWVGKWMSPKAQREDSARVATVSSTLLFCQSFFAADRLQSIAILGLVSSTAKSGLPQAGQCFRSPAFLISANGPLQCGQAWMVWTLPFWASQTSPRGLGGGSFLGCGVQHRAAFPRPLKVDELFALPAIAGELLKRHAAS